MSAIISDTNNFIIIDPNSKEINENGNKRIVPKAVEQESLVIFCNLKSYPKERSYILQGNDKGENKIVNVASGQFNLLKPNPEKDKFTTDWTDINLQNGQLNGEEALGITSIDIAYDTSYVPRVTINMVDVRSQALNSYEEGSPYKTFFSFPYPLFILEVKGYYGKLVKYILHLKKYNSRFNYNTGNFEITCEFVGFTFAVLSDLNIYLGLVASQIKLPSPIGNGSDILNEIYDNQIKNEKDGKKKQEIQDIKNNCRTLYELIRKAKSIQEFFSDFGLKSSDLFDSKIMLDEYLKYLEDFLILIPKPDTNYVNLNTNKKSFNELSAIKKYPQLELKTKESTEKTLNEDKTNFIEDLNKLRNVAAELYKGVDELINESLRTSVENFLGFKPTIENVFRIVCNNFQVFLNLLGKTSIEAAKKEKRGQIYKQQRDLTNNMTQELEKVFPWPYIWDKTGEIQFPDEDNLNGGLTVDDYPEIDFVNEYIRAQIEVNELLETSGGTPMPITNVDFNPIHSVQYTKEKPFSNNKILDILYEMLEHSLLASQYQNQSIVENISKSDAQNLIENLGSVNKNYNMLRDLNGLQGLINEIRQITQTPNTKATVDNLKNNFKVINSNDITTNPRVIKINEDLVSGGDMGLNGSLYRYDKTTKSLGSDRSYYKNIKTSNSVKYDNTTGNDLPYYGYPVLSYDKTINPKEIDLSFLKGIVPAESSLIYKYKNTKDNKIITEGEYLANPNPPNVRIPVFNIFPNATNEKLKDITALRESFAEFNSTIYPFVRSGDVDKSLNYQILLSNDTFCIPSNLFDLFDNFYKQNNLFITKLYTIIPTLFVNILGDYSKYTVIGTNPPGIGNIRAVSTNQVLNIEPGEPFSGFIKIDSSLIKYVSKESPSNNRDYNVYNFLLTTYSSFLNDLLGFFQNYIDECYTNGVYDKTKNDLDLTIPLKPETGEMAKKLYDYIFNWLNSDVTLINSNKGLKEIYNDPFNVVYPPQDSKDYRTFTSNNLRYNQFANSYVVSFVKELNESNIKKLDTSLDDKQANAKKQALITDKNIKLSLYLYFKNINDKWIYTDSETDKATYAFNLTGDIYQNNDKDLIDYFYFVDRGNRYIGDQIYIDIGTLSNYIQKNNANNSLYSLIGEVLSKNEMNFHALTSYVSYFKNNVNDLFDTHLNTLQADSQPAFICQYVGKPVTYQYDNENHFPDYLKFNFDDNTFNSDAGGSIFDLKNSKNFNEEFLNRAVCFTIDVGIQNQNVFKNIQLDQSEFRETQESLIVVDKLTSRDANRFTETIGNNLFNVYARRSYTCKIECLGNMMIQPTMYFYLRYIPLFNGLYLITKVSHNLQGNTLMTNFEGVRVPIYTFPIADSFIATLAKNVYSNYQTNVLPNYTPNPNYYDELGVTAISNINKIYNVIKTKGVTNNVTIAAILAVASKESGFKPIREQTYTTNIGQIKKIFNGNNTFKNEILPAGDDAIKFMAQNPKRYYNKVYYGRKLTNGTYLGNKSDNIEPITYKDIITFDDSANGDGYKYRGGGFNQITGRGVYRQYGLESNPEKITDVDVAAKVLAEFCINNITLLEEKSKYGITGSDGVNALNNLGDDLTKSYDAIFNITAGIGFTLSQAINKYGDSYKKGAQNLQSLYDAIISGKIK